MKICVLNPNQIGLLSIHFPVNNVGKLFTTPKGKVLVYQTLIYTVFLTEIPRESLQAELVADTTKGEIVKFQQCSIEKLIALIK